MPKAIANGYNGICPHCGITVKFTNSLPVVLQAPRGGVRRFVADESRTFFEILEEPNALLVTSCRCPSCEKNIIVLRKMDINNKIATAYIAYPRLTEKFIALEIPEPIRTDIKEAAALLSISEKASAAISRRCLQMILTDRGAPKGDLSVQIDWAIKQLPAEIAENVDAVRNIGNFAAHPLKNTQTGQIVEVEPGEAEWNIEVLTDVCDHYYVKPAAALKRRDALNAKLKSIGKPQLKKP